MAKIKECITGTVRTIRVGTRAARIVRPGPRANDRIGEVGDAYTVSTLREGRACIVTERDLESGSVIWLTDPGSRGQDAENPRGYTAWANVVV